MVVEYDLKVYLCSHCARVHNSYQECYSHELAEHSADDDEGNSNSDDNPYRQAVSEPAEFCTIPQQITDDTLPCNENDDPAMSPVDNVTGETHLDHQATLATERVPAPIVEDAHETDQRQQTVTEAVTEPTAAADEAVHDSLVGQPEDQADIIMTASAEDVLRDPESEIRQRSPEPKPKPVTIVSHKFPKGKCRRFDRPNRCRYCRTTFTTTGEFARHRAHCQTDETKKYKCDFCARRFGKYDSRDRHENIHTGNRPTQCRYPPCEARFNQSMSRLTHERIVHLKIHPKTKVKVADLPVKPKAPKAPRRPRTKVKVPTYNAQLWCRYCRTYFASAAERQVHVSTCETEHILKYKCLYCEKRFTEYTIRTQHEYRHTGQRPYHCRYPPCTMGFIALGSRRSHEKRAHAGETPEADKVEEGGADIVDTTAIEGETALDASRMPSEDNQEEVVDDDQIATQSVDSVSEMTTEVNHDDDNLESETDVVGDTTLASETDDAHVVTVPQSTTIEELDGSALSPQPPVAHEVERSTSPSTPRQDDDPPRIPRNLRCFYCRTSYESTEERIRHVAECQRGHTKRYKCDFCDIRFMDSGGRGVHERRHKKNGHIVCQHPTCEIVFASQYARQQHERTMHTESTEDALPLSNVEGRPQPSPMFDSSIQADAATLTAIALITTTAVAEPAPQRLIGTPVELAPVDDTFAIFTCKYCRKNFEHMIDREVHGLECESGHAKKYKCDYCPQRYGSSQGRTNHERRHKRECTTTFPCTYLPCQLKFGTLYRRTQHQKLMHGMVSRTRCKSSVGKHD